MTAQTQVYIYNQRQTVVLLQAYGAIATRRYDIVYAKELMIQRGVSNLLEFAFINQDQKAINMLNVQQVLLRIISNDGSQLLLQKQLTPVLPLTGIYNIQLTADETELLSPQQGYYSLEAVGQQNEAVFTDAQGSARGIVRIVDSIFPRIVQSQQMNIPSHLFPQQGKVSTYPTSVYYTNGQQINTFQATYANFIGNIQFEGCNVQDFVNNYTIDAVYSNGVYANTFTYGNSEANIIYSGTEGYVVTGYHPYIRILINNVGSNTVPNLGSNQKEANNNQNNLYGDMITLSVR
jgi:hypothetical protein